ncbi:carbonic anhydrase 2-like isoform 2-T2 [Cochliomyia hominivorax]
MQFSVKIILFVVFVALFKANDAYEHTNQALWYDIDGAECSGDRQSPIELNSLDALISYGIPSIRFHNFNLTNMELAELVNNGHSADLTIPRTNFASISGGPLEGATYITESLHFHWGSRNYHGAEHVVDSRRSSMEMHIVHRNSKYLTVDEATRHPDGLAVLGIFYHVDSSADDFVGLKRITDALPDIQEYNSSTKVKRLNLLKLFGHINTEIFYTYEGSLTTPPCSQAVTWIVFPEVIKISQHQIDLFRSLYDSHGNALVNNYRHLQAKGKRQVYLRRDSNEVKV